ncbi:MAG: hypothetical protein P1U65_00690 [Minwuia sp.]|nr:hypothetical protein [Minwuia sp.]
MMMKKISRIRGGRWIGLAIAGLIMSVLPMTQARAADVIVLDSTISAFAPGTSLPANALIDIPAGGSMSVMDGAGATRVIRGPYAGAVASGAPSGDGSVMSMLGQLVKEDERERSQLGAVRAFSKDDMLRDPLAIDVSRNTTFCLPHASSPKFWRPGSLDRDTRFTVKDWSSNNEPLVAYWREGDRELGWPPTLSTADGTTFLMKVEAAKSAAEVTILKVPDTVGGNLETIVWMAQHGCREQARRMVGNIREPATTQ